MDFLSPRFVISGICYIIIFVLFKDFLDENSEYKCPLIIIIGLNIAYLVYTSKKDSPKIQDDPDVSDFKITHDLSTSDTSLFSTSEN